ncbi:hypothetical protein FACS1894103_5660 [Campylobacterota bacterium]|nr:hypothetical protein FACS1894103_5660 [Campylobacterota bacterium]
MIGIIGAMTEEIEPILAHLDDVKTQRIGGNDYHFGSYNGREVSVAYSKIGKVNAAQSATVMINGFYAVQRQLSYGQKRRGAKRNARESRL